ncbi:cytochrome P450 family protein [Rhynchospora pubera]|uniref:Cytochrome P450 family protein n=1 Tax=Rhynchospora pubera TaxID=906938 RepID=A0AAV8BWN4_9POAL|nr:cytochrome P450 family protein [Rhynchospora pubera]
MSDACARATETSWDQIRQHVPQNTGCAILLASSKGTLQPHLSFVSFLVLVGPYLLLLSIQVLTEALSRYGRSPAWLITPVVYEGYRILQLMRGITLAGDEVGAPVWMAQTLPDTSRVGILVGLELLMLGIQLMQFKTNPSLPSRLASLFFPSPFSTSQFTRPHLLFLTTTTTTTFLITRKRLPSLLSYPDFSSSF